MNILKYDIFFNVWSIIDLSKSSFTKYDSASNWYRSRCVTTNKKMFYIIGNDNNWDKVANVYKFDPYSEQLSNEPSLKKCKSGAMVICIDTNIMVWCGYDIANGEQLLSKSVSPTNNPTFSPSISPTTIPSIPPSLFPSISPSNLPSNYPSFIPTNAPSNIPTFNKPYNTFISYQLNFCNLTNKLINKFMLTKNNTYQLLINNILEKNYVGFGGVFINYYDFNVKTISIYYDNKKVLFFEPRNLDQKNKRRLLSNNNNNINKLIMNIEVRV